MVSSNLTLCHLTILIRDLSLHVGRVTLPHLKVSYFYIMVYLRFLVKVSALWLSGKAVRKYSVGLRFKSEVQIWTPPTCHETRDLHPSFWSWDWSMGRLVVACTHRIHVKILYMLIQYHCNNKLLRERLEALIKNCFKPKPVKTKQIINLSINKLPICIST